MNNNIANADRYINKALLILLPIATVACCYIASLFSYLFLTCQGKSTLVLQGQILLVEPPQI